MAPQSDTPHSLRPSLQLGRHSSQPCFHLDLRCAFRAANGRLGGICHVEQPLLQSLSRLCYCLASDLVCHDWLLSFVIAPIGMLLGS
jgi:hypothetical protein